MYNKFICVAVLAIILTACNQNNNQSRIHDEHHHEDEKVQYTKYTDDYELFVEADAFVVGENAELLAHITSLANFKPLDSAEVTAILTVDGNTVSQTVNDPKNAGMYQFSIEPEKAGKGTLIFKVINKQDSFSITVPEIYVYADHHDIKKYENHEASKVNTIMFSKMQSWKIDFATAFPKKEGFGKIIKTVAKVEPERGEETILSAKTSGIVLFTDNDLVEGKTVVKGQKLFSISSDEMSEHNIAVQLAEAKSNFETSKANFERKSELLNDKLVSEQEMLKAKNEYETTKAIYENLVKNFSTSGQIITSRTRGFIKEFFVANGEYVQVGHPLVSIAQSKNLLLTANVQQKYLELMPMLVSANIKAPNNKKTYSLEELDGKILSYGRATTKNSYLLPVSIRIVNKAGFVPGTFIEIYLKTITNLEALTVPNSALIEEQGIYHVFVQITPELFEEREVQTGNTDGIKTEIISGITERDRIITRGAMQVKLAQSSGALDAHSGHIH